MLDLRDRGEQCLDHPLIRLIAVLKQRKAERLRVLVNEAYTPLEGLTKVIPLLGYRIEHMERISENILMLDLVRETSEP